MCVIFSAPKGNQIPLEALQDGTDRNSDGWGVMWHDGNELIHEKSPKADAAAIYEITKKIPHQTVVHLRMTTHGHNSMDNTHPFEIVPSRLLMMHNGVVDVDVPHRSQRSDTRVFVDDYLKPLIGNRPGRIRNKGLKNFIQNLIGHSSNRLVFLDDEGNLTYFNKSLGIEWKGLWASNTYGWSLHSEGRELKRITNYNSYKNWTRGFDDSRYDSYWNKGAAPVKGIYDDAVDDLKWAAGNVQAADDVEDEWDANATVETEFGFTVPAWCGSVLNLDYEEMLDEAPETLAAVIENLRDTYIGETR